MISLETSGGGRPTSAISSPTAETISPTSVTPSRREGRTADERDRVADEREAALDDWERRWDGRAVQLGVLPDGTQHERDQAAVQRAEARISQESQRQKREDCRVERDTSSARRKQATKRRQAATPHTALAMAFAEITRHLYEDDTFDEVLSRITEVAVSTIAGCQLASTTLREDSVFRTAASTHAEATEVDQAQYQTSEGPCLNVVENAMVYASAFPDDRWPLENLTIFEQINKY